MSNTNNKTGWKVWIGGLMLVGLAASGFIFMALKKKEALAVETGIRI